MVIAGLSISLWYVLFPFGNRVEITNSSHDIVLDKMEGMGKIEVVKYQFKDIVKHEKVKDWWPDPKIFLVVAGEAVACIDLTKLDSTDVFSLGDSIYVQMPEPELCYAKIDHSRSQVYDTEYTFWDEAEMVAEAYEVAEKELIASAYQSGIITQAEEQAELSLKPVLETLTGKSVFLIFPPPKLRQE